MGSFDHLASLSLFLDRLGVSVWWKRGLRAPLPASDQDENTDSQELYLAPPTAPNKQPTEPRASTDGLAHLPSLMETRFSTAD